MPRSSTSHTASIPSVWAQLFTILGPACVLCNGRIISNSTGLVDWDSIYVERGRPYRYTISTSERARTVRPSYGQWACSSCCFSERTITVNDRFLWYGHWPLLHGHWPSLYGHLWYSHCPLIQVTLMPWYLFRIYSTYINSHTQYCDKYWHCYLSQNTETSVSSSRILLPFSLPILPFCQFTLSVLVSSRQLKMCTSLKLEWTANWNSEK